MYLDIQTVHVFAVSVWWLTVTLRVIVYNVYFAQQNSLKWNNCNHCVYKKNKVKNKAVSLYVRNDQIIFVVID